MGNRPPTISQTQMSTSFGNLAAVLSVPKLAEALGLRSKKTIYEWVAKGHLDGTYRKRGKHLLFLRDKVMDRIFNGPDWSAQ